jgi:hypothetical protein
MKYPIYLRELEPYVPSTCVSLNLTSRPLSPAHAGIAVAMVCAQKGYKCVICMAEPFSVERRKIMRMLGAKVIGMAGCHT